MLDGAREQSEALSLTLESVDRWALLWLLSRCAEGGVYILTPAKSEITLPFIYIRFCNVRARRGRSRCPEGTATIGARRVTRLEFLRKLEHTQNPRNTSSPTAEQAVVTRYTIRAFTNARRS